jgi:hypothetical protein
MNHFVFSAEYNTKSSTTSVWTFIIEIKTSFENHPNGAVA